MSSALLAALFAILGTGLAVTSTACFLLWRRVRALTSATALSPRQNEPTATVSVDLSTPDPGKKPAKPRYEVARRLDDLVGRHVALEARLARIEASTTEAAIVIASEPGGSKIGRLSRVDPGQPATSEGPTLISVPNLASPPSATTEAAAELDRRFGPIWAMADDGTPAEAIARESGYPIGQVELILGLRRRLLVSEAGLDG